LGIRCDCVNVRCISQAMMDVNFFDLSANFPLKNEKFNLHKIRRWI
jgi:hypothetical protein